VAFSLMEGNEAIAWGAYEAGCRFFAGYPITPATSILNTMLKLLPPAGGVVLQGEDEMASIGTCLGASMAGLKAMTATSGPGISLYSEHVSFAIGSEIPLVIVDVQRLGPSTGSATRGADGDIQFMRWGSSSGLPLIVLAPVDVSDCYILTIRAFNLAEEFRCPVFIASNKEVGLTRESVDLDSLPRPELVERTAPPTSKDYLPFVPNKKGVPYFLPIGGKTLVRQTSSTHGRDGYITTDPEAIGANIMRLRDKLVQASDGFSFYDLNLISGAETLIISYGVTSRAVRDASKELAEIDRPVSTLTLKTLWPVPEGIISQAGREAKRVIVVEMNAGQYVREIERVLPDKRVEFFGQMDGRLITPRQIKELVADG
jgi:2-oxoglutarate ferredoxin oxidoreductase subunit alpha